MKFISENLKDLRELYINQLRMLLSAEKQIVIALPTMIEKSTDKQLIAAFQLHLNETEVHVSRLQKILTASTGSVEFIKCKALEALVAETEDMILDARDESVRDVALIAAAQRVEHYEMAAYGAVRRFAEILGEDAAADLLSQTIEEEGNADHALTYIADRVNPRARRAA